MPDGQDRAGGITAWPTGRERAASAGGSFPEWPQAWGPEGPSTGCPGGIRCSAGRSRGSGARTHKANPPLDVRRVPGRDFRLCQLSNAVSLWVSAPHSHFVQGDANSAGSVNLSDAVATLLHLVGGLQVRCLDALDADDSGTVALTNVVRGLDYLFRSGPPPAIPLPGTDPTVGGPLDCANGPA